jgi:hypothetical protein
MIYHREIANQTLKNQTTGNVEIRCRLEKIDKTGNSLLKTLFIFSIRRLVNDTKQFGKYTFSFYSREPDLDINALS